MNGSNTNRMREISTIFLFVQVFLAKNLKHRLAYINNTDKSKCGFSEIVWLKQNFAGKISIYLIDVKKHATFRNNIFENRCFINWSNLFDKLNRYFQDLKPVFWFVYLYISFWKSCSMADWTIYLTSQVLNFENTSKNKISQNH